MLDLVSGMNTAKMLDSKFNVFQRSRLLNKLRVRREFYTLEISAEYTTLSSTSRVQHLGSTVKLMGVDIDNK